MTLQGFLFLTTNSWTSSQQREKEGKMTSWNLSWLEIAGVKQHIHLLFYLIFIEVLNVFKVILVFRKLRHSCCFPDFCWCLTSGKSGVTMYSFHHIIKASSWFYLEIHFLYSSPNRRDRLGVRSRFLPTNNQFCSGGSGLGPSYFSSGAGVTPRTSGPAVLKRPTMR